MLVSSTALVPLASADQGLVVLMFMSADGKGVGEAFEVYVEAFQDGSPVDLEDLNVSVGMSGTSFLTFTNTSTGKWHATHTIDGADVMSGQILLFGSASLGTASETIYASYSTSSSGVSTGWALSTRIANFATVGIAPGPGASVVVEARSYNNGALADGGQINFTMNWVEGAGLGGGGAPAASTSTKVQDGVYQTTVQVPADLAKSRYYNVEAELGSSGPSSSTGFSSHPFTVMTVSQSTGTTSATLKAFVGLNTPIAGATLSLSGSAVTMTPPYFTTVGPFDATSDVHGVATITASWGATASPTFWILNVTSGGKLVSLMVSLITTPQGPTGFVPQPPFGFGCEVITQVDTTEFGPGQTANMVFRVTNDGTPVTSTSVARYAWRDGATGTSHAGMVTTDATGNFTMTYVVPSDWSFVEDSFRMQVFCNPDESDTVFVAFGGGGSSNPFGGQPLTVLASGRLGGPVSITATYTGTAAWTGAQGLAAIIPGNQSAIAGVGLAGGGLTTGLTRNGNTYTGSITVPEWLGEGDYTILVLVTNEGATASQADQDTMGNGTVIHLTPQGSTGGGGGTTGGGFIPGFEGALAVGAVGAVGAVAVVSRRRRRD